MGVGFAKDGEGSMRNNRKLKNATKDKYFKFQKYKSDNKNKLNQKPASPEDIERIRIKLLAQKKRATTRSSIAGTITLLVLIYIFFFADFSCSS
ncbi:MAG: hypothetical protein KDB74_06845 [Flavobacteriales bacterium]|nr:hypothetical protein [Flavobacteriales bacterium]